MTTYFSRMTVHPDLNIDNYRCILEQCQTHGYHFSSFNNFHSHDKTIILRHDVDIDLDYALAMAQIEFESSAFSTYFIMLRNPLYNTLSLQAGRTINRLLRLGHHIGLHFDPYSYEVPEQGEEILQLITDELGILSKVTGQQILHVSFHQPTPYVLSNEIYIPNAFESVYNKRFTNDIRYISDSCGQFRNESILELIHRNDTQKIHFLSHPALWFHREQKTLQERLRKIITTRKERLELDLGTAINNSERGTILYE